jgi:DNA-binding MarR family transcriptional regulator
MPSGTSERWSRRDHYWYEQADASAVDVLERMRRHRAAESAMRGRMRKDMHMGDTDFAALRWIIGEERAARPATSAGMSRALGITTAATTKVVGRLITDGYIRRSGHPSDRRAILLSTLPDAHDRLRHALGPLHRRMLELAESLEPAERDTVIGFLDDLTALLDQAPDASRRRADVPPDSERS